MKRNIIFFIGFFSLLLFRLFAGGDFVSQEKIISDLKENKAVLIDVREKNEVDAGMIKDASFIALSEIKENPVKAAEKIKQIAGSKKMYFYCRSGGRSGMAISELSSHGIKGENAGGFSRLAKFLKTNQ